MAFGPFGACLAQENAGKTSLNEADQLGRRLFEQSCGVCHTRPTHTSPLYGPQLSKESLGGNADAMRQVISNGTPRMPAFKYQFTRAQIEAIASYLGTLPVPPPDAGQPAAANPQRVQDN